jgi:DNA transformation protein
LASSADFRDYALDLLRPLGGVSARAMFGGFGLYRDGVIFALISDDTLYLKADAGLGREFQALDMSQFRPRSRGKPLPMPYYEVPPDLLEDGEALRHLARRSLAAPNGAKPSKPVRKARACGKSRATS